MENTHEVGRTGETIELGPRTGLCNAPVVVDGKIDEEVDEEVDDPRG